MSATVEDLAAQAAKLSADDRSRLAELLLATLPDGADAEVEASWDEEIGRRVAEVNAGTARVVSAADVHAAARKIYER
jgi:putative addiction module component (TIGR02574 family)